VEENPACLKRKNNIAGQAVSEGGMVIIAFTYNKPRQLFQLYPLLRRVTEFVMLWFLVDLVVIVFFAFFGILLI
jgi:hypothetical protein